MNTFGTRLAACAAYVKQGGRVADIGTDHGFLAAYLAQHGAKLVIAADKNSRPLSAARHTVLAHNLNDRIDLRCGDGLAVLSVGEVQAIVIAGMGGALMAQILGAAPEVWQSAAKLVLQPMNDAKALRKYIYANAWHVVAEKLVAEGERLYVVILAQNGRRDTPDDFALAVGEKLIANADPLLPRHVAALLAKAERKATGLAKSKSDACAAEVATTLTFCEQLKNFLKNL